MNIVLTVIKLLNCTTRLSNLTHKAWHWLPWSCWNLLIHAGTYFFCLVLVFLMIHKYVFLSNCCLYRLNPIAFLFTCFCFVFSKRCYVLSSHLRFNITEKGQMIVPDWYNRILDYTRKYCEIVFSNENSINSKKNLGHTRYRADSYGNILPALWECRSADSWYSGLALSVGRGWTSRILLR